MYLFLSLVPRLSPPAYIQAGQRSRSYAGIIVPREYTQGERAWERGYSFLWYLHNVKCNQHDVEREIAWASRMYYHRHMHRGIDDFCRKPVQTKQHTARKTEREVREVSSSEIPPRVKLSPPASETKLPLDKLEITGSNPAL